MSTKSVDFARAGEIVKTTRQKASLKTVRWSPSWWLYFVLAFLVLVSLTFAAIVWSILLSPLT